MQFERKTLPVSGKKSFFPSYTIDADHHLDLEKRVLYVHLQVKSRRAKTAVVAFNFEVDAILQCAEFDRAEQALQEFSAGTTPMMLLWPYVRPYMNAQMYHLGLPDFHLPLVLRWEKEGDKLVSEVKGQHL